MRHPHLTPPPELRSTEYALPVVYDYMHACDTRWAHSASVHVAYSLLDGTGRGGRRPRPLRHHGARAPPGPWQGGAA